MNYDPHSKREQWRIHEFRFGGFVFLAAGSFMIYRVIVHFHDPKWGVSDNHGHFSTTNEAKFCFLAIVSLMTALGAIMLIRPQSVIRFLFGRS